MKKVEIMEKYKWFWMVGLYLIFLFPLPYVAGVAFAVEMPNQAKVTDILTGFIKEGFFDEAKRIGQVTMKLQKEGFFIPTSTIHPLLGRLVLKEQLGHLLEQC